MLRVLNCITQEHDLRLVGLSACICLLGCFTTVALLYRAIAAGSPRSQLSWQVAAALILGSSVWSLHFVAMLAYMPGLALSFHAGLTALSAAVAVGGAMLALVALHACRNRTVAALWGGLAIGCGVAGMHYVGAAAMRFSGFLLFDRAEVLVSVAVSLLFATVATLRFTGTGRLWRRFELTAWMTLGICGLHFTGMTAMTLVPGAAGPLTDAWTVGSTTLAFWVGAVSLTILLACLVATLFEQHLSDRSRRELARMRLMSNFTREALVIHRDGEVLELNSAGERLFRTAAEELAGRPLSSLFAESSMPALMRRATCAPAELHPEEMMLRAADGTEIPVELSCQCIDYFGRPATVMSLRDLSDRKRDEARIRHLARHDGLTDLPNRSNLEERLELALKSASRDTSAVAVIVIDLDRFGAVNNLLGYAAGDDLLIQVARRLLDGLYPQEILARMGGDEFVMVLTEAAQPEIASAIVARLLKALRQPFAIAGQPMEIGASLGIALYPGDGTDTQTLLRAAGVAMNRVKEDGGGAACFYEPFMNAQLQARRQLEWELAQAVERDQLRLMYQPMINGTSGETETFEALIRWRHPERGMVPPIEFIPLAEQTDMMGRIGEWVIDTACAAAAGWPHPWRVSLNVSPCQFRSSDVPAAVEAALARHGLPPERLVIEITEGVFIDDTSHAVEVLSRLRRLGVRLALDDFGTGYSSLSYLQLFKFDKFKIDKSFVQRLGENGEALTIVKAIVDLGHTLGLHVTAEGVETQAQLATLRALGVDQLQGYLFGRPAPIGTYTEFDMARVRAMFAPERSRMSA